MVAVAAVCSMAQAKILRVNNTTGSGAPYTKIDDALEAAETGDTIMVDGSGTSYGNITVKKRVVLMGPGYWRAENGISGTGASNATIGLLTIQSTATGFIMRGMHTTGNVRLSANNVVLNRCLIEGDIHVVTSTGGTADNTIIHQNFIAGRIIGYSESTMAKYTQITNNFIYGAIDDGCIRYIENGYIAYNIIGGRGGNIHDFAIHDIKGCTVTRNILNGVDQTIDTNTYTDNCYSELYSVGWGSYKRDGEYIGMTLSEEDAAATAGKGAFNGDDPYVISGIPAGPVIQDVTVPASVEQGNNLNITIKLGVQK